MERLGDKIEEIPQEVKNKDKEISMKEKVLMVSCLNNRSSKNTNRETRGRKKLLANLGNFSRTEGCEFPN